MSDLIERQAAIDIVSNQTFYADYDNMDELSLIDGLKALPSVSTEKSLDKAKSEIRCGENKAYNADFTMGCEYALSVIERMFEEVEE